MPPAVSVILNCYNHEPYVAEAIESVLAQTFADFELILIDNGSTDGSRAVLERYAGVYDVGGTEVAVTRSGDGLYVQDPSGEVDRLHPETRTRFFFEVMDTQVTFKLDARRRVTGAVVHQDGQRILARRIG